MKNKYKEYYGFKNNKEKYLDIKEMIYLTVKGEGDPETSKSFKRGIELLYKFSYKVRMSYKSENPIPNFEKYVVGPLEGIWTFKKGTEKLEFNKDNFEFKLMINQPSFFTKDIFEKYKNELIKENKDFDKVKYEVFKEGEVIQIGHLGSFDDEPITLIPLFERLKEDGKDYYPGSHHEIYLSDFRRVPIEKRKTIIRYKIK